MQCLPPVQRWENKADSQSKRKATTLLGDAFSGAAGEIRLQRCRAATRTAGDKRPAGAFFRFAHTLFESLIQKEKHHPVGWCFFWRSRRDSNSRYAFGVHTISSRDCYFLLFLNAISSSKYLNFSSFIIYLVLS